MPIGENSLSCSSSAAAVAVEKPDYYEITGNWDSDNQLYEKYEELSERVNEILRKVMIPKEESVKEE